MRAGTVSLRFLFPLLVFGAGYILGAGPVWSMGLLLLTSSICFPVFGTGKLPSGTGRPQVDFTCPAGIRRWIYPVILIGGCTVCFFSVLQNSSNPDSLKYDSFRLDLNGEEETGYSRKVRKSISGGSLMVCGNFTKETRVEADGVQLKRTTDRKKFLAEPSAYYFDGITYIEVSPKFKRLTAIMPRKIIRKLASPYWLFVLLLAICLWSSCCETGLLSQSASPVSNPDRLLLIALSVSSVAFITWMYGQLLPIKYTMDGPHYLSFTAGNPIPAALVSYRTPGYPLLLKGIVYLSPLNHNALIVVQYGIYFLALGWLVYELYRAGLPSVCSLALLIIFSRYMFSFHNFMLADSPGLSGIILLLAFGAAWYRKLSAGCTRRQLVLWYVAGALLVFAQLMIKPFPGTIFIPGGLVFLMFLFDCQPGKAFRHAVGFSLAAMILPLLFCGFRYWKTGDFNFASLASFQMCSTAIILQDPAKAAQLEPSIRKDMECIIAETLKENPELKWPIDLEELKTAPLRYETYANRIMYHPGIRNGSWLRDKGLEKTVSYDVGVELACKKLLSGLLVSMDWDKFFQLQKLYLRQLGKYLYYPALVAEIFAENSPFGKYSRVLFLFLLPLSAEIYLGRLSRNMETEVLPRCNFRLMFMLAALALLGVCGTISTFVLVTPFIEVRREMIGLFSLFFGTFGLIVYSFFYIGTSLLHGLFGKHISG